MNKLTIPSILAATVLIAGIFAFMPVEKASTVHTGIGTNQIEQIQKTLPTAGTTVTLTITASTDTVINDIWADNTPTTGVENDFDVEAITVG